MNIIAAKLGNDNSLDALKSPEGGGRSSLAKLEVSKATW